MRREKATRFKIDLIGLFVFALIVAAFFVFVGRAQALRVPHPGNPAPVVQRRQLQRYAQGCFHVARYQWVCPLPDPRAHG